MAELLFGLKCALLSYSCWTYIDCDWTTFLAISVNYSNSCFELSWLASLDICLHNGYTSYIDQMTVSWAGGLFRSSTTDE